MFFYDILATLSWDHDRWRWIEGYRFLNYTSKFGRNLVINIVSGKTKASDKWQGYLPCNYKFYWSQVWDPARFGNEAEFMWSMWHKVVVVNEWRAHIAPLPSAMCVLSSKH